MIYVINDFKSKYAGLNTADKSLTDHCIKKCLSFHYGYDVFQVIEIVRDDRGKPFIRNDLDTTNGINISVSHSENVFACAVAPFNLGLDIQFRRDMDYVKFSGRFYSRAEQALVAEVGESAFFRSWTRREAFAKYTGEGIERVVTPSDVGNIEGIAFNDMKIGEELYVSICADAESKGYIKEHLRWTVLE